MDKSHYLLILVVLFSGCSSEPSVANENFDVAQGFIEKGTKDFEECAIYSALIDQMYVQDGKNAIVIFNETNTYSLPYPNMDEALKAVEARTRGGKMDTDLLKDFLSRNESPRTLLPACIDIGVKFKFVTNNDLKTTFIDINGWTEFHKRYPRSIPIDVSRVGFNEKRNQVLVYTSQKSGPKAGQGYYVILTRENGNWIIKQRIDAWTS